MNGHTLSVRSKKKYIHIINDKIKEIDPERLFKFEQIGLTKDGKSVLGNNIVKNESPLKPQKENPDLKDEKSSRYIPLNDEDKKRIIGFLNKEASKKVTSVYGYDEDLKCFTKDNMPIDNIEAAKKLFLRLNSQIHQADSDKWEHFSFIKDGSKIGKHVGSFSLPPIESCAHGVPCADSGCYAIKAFAMRPGVEAAQEKNYALINEGRFDQFVSECVNFIRKYKITLFRFHVSGDVYCNDMKGYVEAMMRIASECKELGVRFWTYTKMYNAFSGVNVPENFTVILSAWGKFQPPESMAKKFPVAFLYDPADENIKRYVPEVKHAYDPDEKEGIVVCPCTEADSQHVTCETCTRCFSKLAHSNLAFLKH